MSGRIKLYGANSEATTVNGLCSISNVAALSGVVSMIFDIIDLYPDFTEIGESSEGVGFVQSNTALTKDVFKIKSEPYSLSEYHTKLNTFKTIKNKQYIYLEVQSWLFDVFGNAVNAMPIQLNYTGETEQVGTSKLLSFDATSQYPRS